MERHAIREQNRTYWNAYADLWFGTTALPEYGVFFPTEDELQLFGDVSGKRLLEVCCGSGHSLRYLAERGAGELWGVDFSERQLQNAGRLLREHGVSARLLCSPMEEELDVPHGYFDMVYSIYGIGWTTDLEGTFQKIASYLKPGGRFLFTWHHTLNYCVAWSCRERRIQMENGALVFCKSYFDEGYFKMPVDGSEIILCNRKISTYVNALAKAGFTIERMVEETDGATRNASGELTDKQKKAQMLPLSVLFLTRKL